MFSDGMSVVEWPQRLLSRRGQPHALPSEFLLLHLVLEAEPGVTAAAGWERGEPIALEDKAPRRAHLYSRGESSEKLLNELELT